MKTWWLHNYFFPGAANSCMVWTEVFRAWHLKTRRESAGARLRRLPVMVLVPWHWASKRTWWAAGWAPTPFLSIVQASTAHPEGRASHIWESSESKGQNTPQGCPTLQLENLCYLSFSPLPETVRLMTLQSLPKRSPLDVPLEDSPFPQPLPHDPVTGTVSPVLIWNSSY